MDLGAVAVFSILFVLSTFTLASTDNPFLANDPQSLVRRGLPLPPTNNNTQCQIYPTTIESWNQLGVEQYLATIPGGKQLPLEDFTFANHVSNFACGLGENCLAGQQCQPFQGPLWFTLYALQEWNLYVNSLDEATTAAIGQVREISASMINDFLISPDIHKHQAESLAILMSSVAAVAILGLGVGLFGPVLFPAWGVATAVDLAEDAGAFADLLGPEVHLRKRSLSSQNPTQLSELSSEAVSDSNNALKTRLIALDRAKSAVEQQKRLKLIKAQGSGDGFASPPDLLGELKATVGFLQKSAWSPWLSGVVGGHPGVFLKARQSGVQNKIDEPQETRLRKRAAPHDIPKDHFYTWTVVNTYLTSFSDHLKAVIAVTSQIGVTAPVSSDEGVWGILRGGKFMLPNPSMSQLQDKIRETMRLSALAQVFKSMNVFVTIGSDKCKGKGPGGANAGKDRLSYCSPEGLMMNLIRATKKKTVNKIVNAHLVNEKYGYNVEFLAQSAWSCQEHNLKIEGRPKPVGLKSDSKVGCTFDLPVCDTRIAEVARLRHAGKTTVEACRTGLALNI